MRVLGALQPRKLVALFHGLGGNAGSLAQLAAAWAAELPHTGFVLLEAPGGDWTGWP